MKDPPNISLEQKICKVSHESSGLYEEMYIDMDNSDTVVGKP